ncbi:MAG: transglycosylase SLT domain-containing protein [Bdellovibrio bacteriovorus]
MIQARAEDRQQAWYDLEKIQARIPDLTQAAPLRALLFLALAAAVLGLNGCSSSGGGGYVETEVPSGGHRYSSSGSFPIPDEIKPNVDFWRHVYGVWSRGQVAIHDDEHMGVIYEVLQLPAPIQEGYTSYQKDLVRARTEYHRARVRDLQERVTTNQPLSPADKELLAKFEKDGGTSALYGAEDRIRVQRGLRERFRRGVEISGRYDKAFREVMRAHGVPEDLAYLPHVESSFQTNARSGVGAAGVWQFMPTTGRVYGMDVNGALDERLDPIVCANAAARYLSAGHDKLGSWPLAITSYNHGKGGMMKAKAAYGNDIGKIVKNYKGPAFGFASRNFYAEFLAAREVASNASRYFPEGVRYEEPWPYDRLVLRSSMPAHHLAQHYGVSTATLASLNLAWQQPVRDGRAHLPSGHTVWLPAGSTRRVASHPPPYSAPAPLMIARAEPATKPARPAPKPEPVMASRSKSPAGSASSGKTLKVAQTTGKADKAKGAKASQATLTPAKGTKVAATPAKYHVVKPQETLYRVATINGISVAELRKLNKMAPNDNQIRPGQKLKVGI